MRSGRKTLFPCSSVRASTVTTLWPGSGVCGPAAGAAAGALLGAAVADVLAESLVLEPVPPPQAASVMSIAPVNTAPADERYRTVIAIPRGDRSEDTCLLGCEQCLTPKDDDLRSPCGGRGEEQPTAARPPKRAVRRRRGA